MEHDDAKNFSSVVSEQRQIESTTYVREGRLSHQLQDQRICRSQTTVWRSSGVEREIRGLASEIKSLDGSLGHLLLSMDMSFMMRSSGEE